MSETTSNYVTANGIQIHYYRITPPGGGMPVVLLHGLTDNGLCWAPLADALRERYDLIMPDTRGHGRSDKPESGYDLDTRAADVAALIDALGLDRPALMGHSLGGQAATAVAARYPEKVRGIILEDPAWSDGEGTAEETATRAREWAAGLRASQSLSHEALVAEGRRQNPGWSDAELEPWAASKLEMDSNAVEQIVLNGRLGTWRAYLRQVTCPVLLLTADNERGAIISPQMAADAEGLWRSGRVVHTPGAGHCIHRDQFEPVLAEVRAFLQSLE